MMRIFNLLLVVFLGVSCTGNSQEKRRIPNDTTETLTRMNRMRVGGESKYIDEFIKSHSFSTQKTGTGLRYEIYHHGTGDTPVAHSVVELKYKIFLLDGTLCYTSDSSGNAKFRLGEGQQVAGLEEGVMRMRKGDKARLILPAHLAYGMTGDQNKIPPSRPVFFDIELINVKK